MCFFGLRFVRFVSASSSGGGRYLSTDSNKIDEPFNVEEAETVHVPPPPTEKVRPFYPFLWGISHCNFVFMNIFRFRSWQLLVLGGNGFVGSHVCKEALDRGLSVSSLSRFHCFLNFDQVPTFVAHR